MHESTKLLVIGLDGLDPVLLKKMVDEGKLPHFSKLIKNGVFGKLKSTVPPVTFPAWPAMFTGKNPGNLGTFDFFRLEKAENRYAFNLVTTAKWKGAFVWDILGHEKKRCGVINVPFFAPTKIKGYMLSDFPETSASAYPRELIDDIKPYVRREHDFDPYSSSSREIKRTERNTEIESIVGKKLNNDKSPDVFIQVFRILDITSHHTLLEKDLRRAYERADRLIEQYVDTTNEKNLIIVSDHGIKRMKRKFYISKWLVKLGYLRLKSAPKISISGTLIYKLTSVFPSLETILDDLQRKLRRSTRKRTRAPVSSGITSIIDWERTVALTNTCSASNYVGIWLNKKNRNKTERLKKDLLELKDPKTQRTMVRMIYNREDVYRGRELEKLPDLIVEFDDNYLIVTQLKPILFINTYCFAHSIHGTFIASGPDFRKGKEIIGAEIIDVAPTILHIMRSPVPKDMDGKVLLQVFKADSELSRKPRYQRSTLSPRVKERIRKKLTQASRSRIT